MKFKEHKTKKFIKAFLFSFSMLICLNLLFMYILYLETQNLREQVKRPDFKTLLMAYEHTQLYYADVQNHIWLMQSGYEKIDTKAADFDYGRRRINWAYHPLYPTLGRLLNIFIKSPFWSLCLLNQIVLLSIFVGFYYWNRANLSGYENRLTAWLILLFFIIPPLGYFVNFVLLPAFLIGIAFFSFRHWLRSPQEHRTAFWILIISSFLLGFTRLQGLLVNASCLILLWILIGWFKKALGKTRAAILSVANILPLGITMAIFKYYANDPFAWAKTQKAWGVSFTVPWWPIIRYWKSGLVFNLQSDDMFFAYFRILVFSVFACLAIKRIIFNKNIIKYSISRHYRDSFINLYFVVISSGILILSFFTDLMVGVHRLATLAFLVALIWFEQDRRRMSTTFILFLLFVRAVEFTLFFQGVLAFIW